MAAVTTAQRTPVREPFIERFRMTRKERHNLMLGLLFISPWLIGFVVFLLYPIYYTIKISFTRYTGFGTPEWIGLENYRHMINDTDIVRDTVYFSFIQEEWPAIKSSVFKELIPR